jgi:hypothetical protein
MTTSRRDFLKTTAIAGATVAVDGLSAFGESAGATAAGASSSTVPAASIARPTEYTRGVGIYPGEPTAHFGPVLIPDTTHYRNLALLRPAYHSSSYDYNLTAQLVTDGIKASNLPQWIVVSDASQGPLSKENREVIVDHAPMNTLELRGTPAQIDIQVAGGDAAPEIDRIQLFVVSPFQASPASLTFTVSVSEDGRTWQLAGSTSSPKPASTAGYPPNFAGPNHFFTPTISLKAPGRSRFYRIECAMGDSKNGSSEFQTTWRVGQVAFFKGDQRVEVGGPYSFTSAWMSAGSGQEWVYVDLG